MPKRKVAKFGDKETEDFFNCQVSRILNSATGSSGFFFDTLRLKFIIDIFYSKTHMIDNNFLKPVAAPLAPTGPRCYQEGGS